MDYHFPLALQTSILNLNRLYANGTRYQGLARNSRIHNFRSMLHAIAIGIFPNEQNWRIGNSHIATDTLIAIIKTQRQNFPRRV